MVALLLTRASESLPLWKLPVMATVALASVGESASDRVRALSITTGVDRTLLPSVKVTAPALVASVGAALTAVRATVTVLGALVPPSPSLTLTCTVRAPAAMLLLLLLS